MNNRQSTGIAAGVLALAMAAGPLEAQAPVRVPRSVLERYVGEYGQDGNTIKILLQGDTLIREQPGQRHAFVPISETLFRIGAILTTEFVIDPAGGVTQIVSDGVGFEARLPRKGSPAPPPPPPPAAVRVPRPVLERYVGTYEYIPGQMGRNDLTVVVRLEGDTLIREGTGPAAILTPISETRFRVGDTSLVTEFVVDEAGVTQVMGTGFQQLLARLRPQR
ncbi:hypothetical protein [Longimicrobium sp.]|jgi:hypothetical protein|uniref:hypothetical protein n=1 Tax=Longimicrobium sp. TaxID=2029185 RepID=UPI002ED934B5